MDVFSLRDSVVGEYRKFATSFTTIFADDLRRQIEAIYAEERYWPEPLIQINQTTGASRRQEQVEAGVLDPACTQIFRANQSEKNPQGEPLTLYRHQQEALALAAAGESFVVTTGTGSSTSQFSPGSMRSVSRRSSSCAHRVLIAQGSRIWSRASNASFCRRASPSFPGR